MKLKQKIFLMMFSLIGTILFAQTKTPTLMILPSDNWCVQRYFVTDFDNQGTKQKVPNYKQAFQEDTEIGQVISKIGSLMIDRGFVLKDAEQEIKNQEQQTTEDAMTASVANGSSISESPLDKLKKRAKADIILQIWWSVNKSDSGLSVNFVLEALDAYTSKRIAASSGTSRPSKNSVVPILLQNSVLSNIEPFVKQLKNHFTNLVDNGREVIIRIKRWQNWNKNLETEFEGKELNEIITDWMQKNSVKGKFNSTDVTENFITFEQVRIPMYDKNNNATDARTFAKELQKFLKTSPLNIDCKLMTRGLGEAILILGEK